MEESTGPAPFIGRTMESERLRGHLARAAGGSPGLVVIAGDAGVGKTRLLERMIAEARSDGFTVLEGACLPLGGHAAPYAPVVAVLRDLARATEPGALPAILGPGRRDLARLVPELVDRAADVPTAADPGDPTAAVRLFELVTGALERMARAGPLVVTIEDVHWADRASRDLLAFLARGLGDERILLAFTLRTDEPTVSEALRGWLIELGRLPIADRLELGPMSQAEVGALVSRLLGPDDRGLAPRIAERSAGNPFLAEELAEAAGRGEWGAVPGRLREILLTRLASLDDSTEAVVRAASAIGLRIDDDLLAEALDLPHAAVASALRDAAMNGVLQRQADRDGRFVGYVFRHALLQDALYEELLPGERVRLHAVMAAALSRRLEARPGSVEPSVLAHHWDAAGDLVAAIGAHARAGEAAARVYAFGIARRHYERILELWPRVPDAPDLVGSDLPEVLDRTAEMAAMEGDYETSVTLVRRAIAIVDPEREPARSGSLQERLRWLLWEAGDRVAAEAAVREALRLIPREPPSHERARALAHAAALDMMTGRPREALVGARAAIRAARAASALPEEALGLGIEGWAMASFGRVDEGLARFREAIHIAEIVGSVEGLAIAYMNVASVLDRAGRSADALETARAGYAEVERLGLRRVFGGQLRAHEARMLYHLGRWDESERIVRETLLAGAMPRAEALLRAQLGRSLASRGRFDQARSELAEAEAVLAAARGGAMGGPDPATDLMEAAMELAVWEGSVGEARAVVDRAIAIQTTGTVPDPALAWIGALGVGVEADAVELASASGDPAALALGRERSLAIIGWMRQWLPEGDLAEHEAMARAIDPRAAAVVAQVRAEVLRLEGDGDAATWLATATAWHAVGRPLPEAVARTRAGEALLRAGDRATARVVLAEALGIAEALGAVPLVEVVRRSARIARLDLAAHAAADVPAEAPASASAHAAIGLTPREREVLRYVGAGWSNRDIAEALDISRKTASVHVSNILGKLGVGNRTEAAVAAHRLGLVEGDDPGDPADGPEAGMPTAATREVLP
ncbi:MAG TPA: AAA family ATPase [Candidatus Limnocylindrales bacterium]|nr:AAA family ATPase [Candidatus Limnocylindrales bacterium]